MTSAERALLDGYEPGDVESEIMRDLDDLYDYTPRLVNLSGDGSSPEDWD